MGAVGLRIWRREEEGIDEVVSEERRGSLDNLWKEACAAIHPLLVGQRGCGWILIESGPEREFSFFFFFSSFFIIIYQKRFRMFLLDFEVRCAGGSRSAKRLAQEWRCAIRKAASRFLRFSHSLGRHTLFVPFNGPPLPEAGTFIATFSSGTRWTRWTRWDSNRGSPLFAKTSRLTLSHPFVIGLQLHFGISISYFYSKVFISLYLLYHFSDMTQSTILIFFNNSNQCTYTQCTFYT